MIFSVGALAMLLQAPACNGFSPRILLGVVATESSGNSFAIHDDSAGRSYYPKGRPAAVALIVRLAHDRHAFSVGLTQVENSNWQRYGVDGVQPLDARTNVAVGCAIYRENLLALRAYNTGTVVETRAGDRYAETVFAASRTVVAPRILTIAPLPQRKPKSTIRRRVPVEAFGFSEQTGAFHDAGLSLKERKGN